MVPFETFGAVSYSPSIVTMAVSVAVCEIFSVKDWCDLENRVIVRSRSLEVAPFDRSHTSSYSQTIQDIAIVTMEGVYYVFTMFCCPDVCPDVLIFSLRTNTERISMKYEELITTTNR